MTSASKLESQEAKRDKLCQRFVFPEDRQAGLSACFGPPTFDVYDEGARATVDGTVVLFNVSSKGIFLLSPCCAVKIWSGGHNKPTSNAVASPAYCYRCQQVVRVNLDLTTRYLIGWDGLEEKLASTFAHSSDPLTATLDAIAMGRVLRAVQAPLVELVPF